jgi:hypothetical protein
MRNKNFKLFISACSILFSCCAAADQPRSSELSIWSENDDVYVLHSHLVHAWTTEKSMLKIVRKENGDILFESKTTPFTEIVPVEDGKYFAGLSDLQAGTLPHGYNFALFDIKGGFISRVYVSGESGYCEKVIQSVSQYIRWFSRNPKITLEKTDGKIAKIIVSPIYSNSKPCKIPIGDHLVGWRSKNISR